MVSSLVKTHIDRAAGGTGGGDEGGGEDPTVDVKKGGFKRAMNL
jgi:hypothetical protein